MEDGQHYHKNNLRTSISIHEYLHGFSKGMGTGMDTLEAKLAQQLEGI